MTFASVKRFGGNLRQHKWLIRTVLVIVLYLLGGFFLVPAILKWQLVKKLPRSTHCRATVGQVKCNPLALSLTIRNLDLTETNGAPVASFQEFYANFQLSSLFRWAWTFDDIHLIKPRVEVVLDQAGKLNLARLFLSSTNTTSSNAPFRLPSLLVFNLSITNGHVGFADLSRKTPFRTAYEPINFNVQRFKTMPGQQSPYAFSAASDKGGNLAWEGTITAQPSASTGRLQINRVSLPKYTPYLEDFTLARLTDGWLNITGNYHFALSTNGMDLSVSNLLVTMEKLQIKDPGTSEVVLALPSTEVHDGAFNWRSRQARLGSVVVNEPSALVRRRSDGLINLSTLLKPSAPAVTSPDRVTQPPWLFVLDDYRLNNGTVQFEDATVPVPFRTRLKPLALRVQHFSTATNAEAALQVEITTEAGETMQWAINGSLQPLHSTGQVKIAGLELPRYTPYLKPFFHGQLAAGTAAMEAEFKQELVENQWRAIATNASLRVTNLRVQSPDGRQTEINVPGLAIERASGSFPEKNVQVGAIKSEGAVIFVQRETNGSISLLRLVASPTNAPPATRTNAGWHAELGELALHDWTIHAEDRSVPTPGKLDFDQLALTLRGVQFPSNAPVATEFSTRVNGAGTIALHGSFWPFSPAMDSEIAVASLDLRGFQPWVGTLLKLGIETGALTTKGRVQMGAPEGSQPKLHFTGNLAVTNFATVDQVFFKPLARWNEMSISGIDFSLQPNKATAAQVRFADLKTSVILGTDKRLNLLAILPASAPPVAAPPVTNSAAPGTTSFPFQIGELLLERMMVHFNDLSVQPPCVFDLQQLDGAITGLSSQPDAMATLALLGHIDEASPFALKGKLNPLARENALDLVFTNHNLQLTPFTPYMEKYAGYPLNKGRLSLDLNYTIQAKALKAQNKVRIDQLVLGPRNNSPEATKLPVKLAVALLKDNNGQIELNLPVEGRLDDPQFRLGPIILKVVGNLIVKAAASPFKLLGALVGGGDELSYVEFPPGKAVLVDTETNKLAKLLRALQQRPAVNLDLEGSMDPQLDREALAIEQVRAQIKSQRLRELAAIGQMPAAINSFQPEPAEYERLLRAAVVSTWGTNLTEAIRSLANASAAATNTAPALRHASQGPGLFKRVISVFKAGKERAATRQAYRTAKSDTALLKQNPQLAQLTSQDMERLLATKTVVPAEALRQLMQDRAKAVQAYLLSSGKVTTDRLFLTSPKTPDASFKGNARANLSLN